MYLYLSLVERKVAEFYYNMVKMTYFHRFLQTIDGVLAEKVLDLFVHPENIIRFKVSASKYCVTILTIVTIAMIMMLVVLIFDMARRC